MNKFWLKCKNETQGKLIISLRQLIFVKLVNQNEKKYDIKLKLKIKPMSRICE